MEMDRRLLELDNFTHQEQESAEDNRWREIMKHAKGTEEYRVLMEKLGELNENNQGYAIPAESRSRGDKSTIITIRFDLKNTDVSRYGPRVRRHATRFASKGVGLEFDEDGFKGVRYTDREGWKELEGKGDIKKQIEKGMSKAKYYQDLRYGRGSEGLDMKPKNSTTFRWLKPSFEH